MSDALQSKVQALQAEVERLTKERDQSREQTTAAIEDYNDELSARRAAEAQVQSLTQALEAIAGAANSGAVIFGETSRGEFMRIHSMARDAARSLQSKGDCSPWVRTPQTAYPKMRRT